MKHIDMCRRIFYLWLETYININININLNLTRVITINKKFFFIGEFKGVISRLQPGDNPIGPARGGRTFEIKKNFFF